MALQSLANPAKAAIILAGGEGSRLRSLTSKIADGERPKQFCALLGNETLLEQTRRRVALAVAPEHTVTVVTKAHERFYKAILAGMPAGNLVIQPDARGTATAILYALLRLAKQAPESAVALFPSDHYVDDDPGFMSHVTGAFEVVNSRCDLTVLLGITPDSPEPGYGWVESHNWVFAGGPPVLRVRRFWEKPSPERARKLYEGGCLWNSFVIVGHLRALLGLFRRALPQLHTAFARVRSAIGTLFEPEIVGDLYDRLPAADFSRDVLQRTPANLTVLPVTGIGWTDLGEPRRVMDLLNRMGQQPQFAVA